jgi:hypothetical protein
VSDLRVNDELIAQIADRVHSAAAPMVFSGAVTSADGSALSSSVVTAVLRESSMQRQGRAQLAATSLHELASNAQAASAGMFAADTTLAAKAV